MGEFASGYFGSGSGVVRNAYDPRRSPSSSSAGTGAAIAANLAMVGIGEDTGGSTRGPAAVGSLVGLRPTVALVSRHGMLPSKPTTDTLGPIARTVRDAALLLGARGGAYLGGGIAPKILPKLSAGEFRENFEQKGRMSAYLAPVPVYVITAEFATLKGAAASLRDLPAKVN